MNEKQSMAMIVQIDLKDSDTDELDRVTRQLCDEIRELDVDSVRLATAGTAPSGTKSIDPVLIGALAVAVAPTVLTKFLEFLHTWAMRKEKRTIKIKMQTETGDLLEIEVPATMSTAEAKNWINTMKEILPKHKGKKHGE